MKNIIGQSFVVGEGEINGSPFGELAISPLSETESQWWLAVCTEQTKLGK